MTAKNWMKDILLISVGLSAVVAVAAFLMAKDRIKEPATFGKEAAQADIQNTAYRLDAAIGRSITESRLLSTDRADDLKIARRLSLALAGTLPSVEELREYEKIDSRDRVDWYVSHLLEDKRCSDYLAERFARALVGVEEGPFLIFRRRRFVAWLSEQLYANRRYDQIARQILTDNGLWTDSPAVNYYTFNIIPDQEDETKPDPVRMAARTSRAFLGMRIDCLQCHDDFIGTMNLGSAEDPVAGTQLHFHALASFFSQVENSLVGINDNLESETYRYQLLEADRAERITSTVPFNEQLDDASEQNLRIRLANWTTDPDNRPFARAAVNRVWAIMFGRGLLHPVDDIPLEGPFPETMEILVDDFVTSGFDLHRLIRIIAATNIFQRASASTFEITHRHASLWAAFPMTRLRPDQVAGSIIQSTSLKTIDSTSHIITRLAKFGQQNDFVNRFGDPGEEEFNPRTETITQRLLLLNGDMVKERLDDNLNSPAGIAMLAPTAEKAVETVYLATLTRRPDEEELNHFSQQLKELSNEERNGKIKDIYWILINSVEFAWNH